MNIARRAYCRIFQKIMKCCAPLLPWKKPDLLTGQDSMEALADRLQKMSVMKVLIVSGSNTPKLGLMNNLLSALESKEIEYTLFDKVTPNPTISCVEDGVSAYLQESCQAVIAFGGGSPMDAGKIIAARIAKPAKKVGDMRGLLKIRAKLPPIIAIPTTSGTGSECTIAAVISDEKTGEKYPINDICLTPSIAVLSPDLTLSLPPHITATTGMDALTHAVEAYIGGSNTALTSDMAKRAVALIFDNLKKAYDIGADISAREQMQLASYYAGVAFTRAYVGYVHALAHQLGGLYHIPHGLANAVLLPHVLLSYGDSAYKRLAELADTVGIDGSSDKEKANNFIQAINELNRYFDLPTYFAELQREDIPLLAERADREGNPLYPVPKLMDKYELAKIYERVLKIK